MNKVLIEEASESDRRLMSRIFEGISRLPKEGKGMVHIASFYFAYRLSPVCV